MNTRILKKKNCLITGATGGIGEEISKHLASLSCNLFLTSKEVTIESTFSPTANLSVFCSLFSFAKLDFLINPFQQQCHF